MSNIFSFLKVEQKDGSKTNSGYSFARVMSFLAFCYYAWGNGYLLFLTHKFGDVPYSLAVIIVAALGISKYGEIQKQNNK